VIGELVARSELDNDAVRAMYCLFCTHFARVSEDRFRADLDEKQWVIRIRDGNVLRGFTSLRFISVEQGSRVQNVLYSGDTIVAPEARSTTVLARTWIESVRHLSTAYRMTNLYWLLLVSGFRTYRLLPVFWKEFFPTFAHPTPAGIRQTVDQLATSVLGSAYSATEGIVRFAEPQPLRPELSGVPANRLTDPHIEFFLDKNPGHADGDELVCWTRLEQDNLTQAGLRMWKNESVAELLPRAV
jgi:hypothetical protein